MSDKPQVGKMKWKAALRDMDLANRAIIAELGRLQGSMDGRAGRSLLKIAVSVATQQVAISELQEIARYANGEEDE